MPESMTIRAAEPSATDVYALGRDPGESARLQRQSESCDPTAQRCWTGKASGRARARST